MLSSVAPDDSRAYAHRRGRRRLGGPPFGRRGRTRMAGLAGAPPLVGDNGQPAHPAIAAAGHAAGLAELGATIAHEVNQPLAAIVMRAEAGLRRLSRDELDKTKVEQLIRHIAAEARRASDIVQCVRRMAAKDGAEFSPVDLGEVVEGALRFVRHEVEARSIDLSVTLGAGLAVVGDRIQLQQAIVNLLVNGIQAVTRAGGARRRIELETGAEEGAVSFTIRDSGPGIADEDLDRVFESFFTRKAGGTGIGLALCRSVVTAHGGRVAASNHCEGGAQFRLVLPAMPRPGMVEEDGP